MRRREASETGRVSSIAVDIDQRVCHRLCHELLLLFCCVSGVTVIYIGTILQALNSDTGHDSLTGLEGLDHAHALRGPRQLRYLVPPKSSNYSPPYGAR